MYTQYIVHIILFQYKYISNIYALPENFHTHTHTHTYKTLTIKVWVLADSCNGYFHTLQVYTGKEGSGEKQLGQRVVKDLTRLLKGKNHHVFFDNFFTSEELLQDLLKDDIFACGTARKDRRGFPAALKSVKLKKR